MSEWLVPSSLRGFLGLAGFYRHFIKVLSLPKFSIPFIVECDASCNGIGVTLQQEGHPIAFFSKNLANRHLKLLTYERELIGLTQLQGIGSTIYGATHL